MTWKIIRIMAGTFMMAMAVNFIFEPMNMVMGGVAGLAIVVKELTQDIVKGGFPVWITNLAANIPIFLFGYFVKGKGYLGYTFFANLCFSVFMLILPVTPIEQKDYFLSAVAGGALTGGGLGLVFAAGCSTGGMDLLSSIIQSWLKSYPVAVILFVLDAIVILAGAMVFGFFTTAYAVVSVFISSKIMDEILSGLKLGKQIWIISEEHQRISNAIIQQMGRGVTCVEGQGMYTKKSKNILFCVVGKRQIMSVVSIVRMIDRAAFIVVQDAREVMGEGFREISE